MDGKVNNIHDMIPRDDMKIMTNNKALVDSLMLNYSFLSEKKKDISQTW